MADEQHIQRPVEPGHRYRPRHIPSRPVASFGMDGFRRGPVHHTLKVINTPPPQPVSTVVKTHVQPVHLKQNVPAAVPQRTKPALPRQGRSMVLKRQFVQRAGAAKRKQRQQLKRQAMAFIFGGVAASLVVGVFVVNVMPKDSGAAQSPGQPTVLSANSGLSSAAISELAPTTEQINGYEVKADEPRVLSIPKLQLNARIMPVMADLNNEPLAPKNIYDTGWFNTTAAPGGDGVTLLNGQVIGSTKPGIFSRLNELIVGDVLEVERGDGKIFKFRVVKSQQYDADKVDMHAAAQSAIAGKPGLNLLTCTGRYNVKTNQFEKRTIIFAVQQ